MWAGGEALEEGMWHGEAAAANIGGLVSKKSWTRAGMGGGMGNNRGIRREVGLLPSCDHRP